MQLAKFNIFITGCMSQCFQDRLQPRLGLYSLARGWGS